jgi:hypothetical protein
MKSDEIQTTINLPKTLHRKLRIYAIENNTTMADVIKASLKVVMEKVDIATEDLYLGEEDE